MIILIPAYEPDEKLLGLLDSIDPEIQVVVVDDGSSPSYAPVFQQAAQRGCDIISYPDNRGKGYALKAGFAHIRRAYPGHCVVCADSDGQHLISDIHRVACALADTGDAMVLGVRHFTGKVPLRSKIGNAITARVFALTTGTKVIDTQTGLRAYPAQLLPWLMSVEGDRFEYEFNLLLQAKDAGYSIEQVPIETVYLADNESSHFRPVRDSLRIYAPLVKFGASSMLAGGIDMVALFTLHALGAGLFGSVVCARALSSMANFVTNRRFVFDKAGSTSFLDSAIKYFALVGAILAANYTLMATLTGLGLGLLLAKIITEVTLFTTSYFVQQRFVFARRRHESITAKDLAPAA